jgi:hypothetical protein
VKLTFLFGYLDPGTGSIVAQTVIGAIAGVGLFGRRMFYNLISKIKNFFSASKKTSR